MNANSGLSLLEADAPAQKGRHVSGPFRNKSRRSSRDMAVSLIKAQFSAPVNNFVPQCEDCGLERLETGSLSRSFQGEKQTTRTKDG